MFFRDDDPLSNWLFFSTEPFPKPQIAQMQNEIHQGLDNLAAMLDDPDPKRRRLTESGINAFRTAPLGPADLARAQVLYRRLVAAGGNGVNWVQEGLLNAIAVTADPASIPFWL